MVEDSTYLTFSIAEKANAFMSKHQEEPFFLYVPFNAPHTPFQVPVEYYERFPDETDHNRRVYAAMIAALDDAVGSMLDHLDETEAAGRVRRALEETLTDGSVLTPDLKGNAETLEFADAVAGRIG